MPKPVATPSTPTTTLSGNAVPNAAPERQGGGTNDPDKQPLFAPRVERLLARIAEIERRSS